jgi:uncharacterized delta-60 repeat protein
MYQSLIFSSISSQIRTCVSAVLEFFKVIFVTIPFIALLVACGGGSSDGSNSSNGGSSSGSNAIYSVSGTVTGLSSGSLVLNNNGADALTVAANTSNFTFATNLASGDTYVAKVTTQPSGLGCFVSNGSGTVALANITNIAVSCYPNWADTKQMGGGTTIANGVTVDASGKVYVAGQTTGNLDTNTRTGDIDFFLTKYSYSGVMQYTRQSTAQFQQISGLINTNETIANSVATDTDGNVYVTGYTNADLDRSTSMTLSGITDFFLIKYNSAGVKQYTKQMGDSGNRTTAQSVAVDASGNVYVAGNTNGNLDGLPIPSYLTTDIFLAKYNSNGDKQYIKMWGGAASTTTIPNSVTVDGNGDIYVAGETNGNLDTNTLAGTKDFFVTKYNSAGTKLYTKQLGVASSTTIGWSVAVDASGNVYVAGETTGNLGRTRVGSTEFFLTKYNSTGTLQYTKQLGAAAFTTTVAKGVTVDASGNVYVAGYTNGGLDGNTLAGTYGYFLTKYNSAGDKQYTRQVGVTGKSTKGNSVAIDAIGNVYVAGQTTGGLDNNATPSGTDFFVAKYNSAGVKQ